MKKFYFLAAILFTSFFMNAQVGKRHVLFSSQTVTFPNEFSQQLFLSGDKPVEGKFLRAMQFHKELSNADKLALENLGVTFHDYIPYNTFIVTLPANINIEKLPRNLVRSVMPIAAEWRLSRNLFLNFIPEWAIKPNNQVELVVVPAPHLSNAQVRHLLERSGVRMDFLKFSGQSAEVVVALDDINRMAALPFVLFIHPMEEPGEPENDRSRIASKVSMLNARYGIPDAYNGSGVTISLGDDGDIGPHIDYTGRLTSVAGPSQGDHGDHVAGTIFGAGNRNPTGMGMAPGADMLYYSYPVNLNNVTQDYANAGIRITSSSYSNGCNAGYTLFTRDIDLTSYVNPKLIHVFSAGNSGTQDCNYGAGLGWGNITGGHKIGKNAIAVANFTHEDVLANSSSRGPASDGRIKPEVGTVGSSVFSTTDPHNYNVKTGTSMSCPGTSGSLAIIYQAYKEKNLSDPDGGVAKAHLMNTADDLGNPGPDFKHGFGKINVPRAIQAIEASWEITDSLSSNQTKNHSIVVPANTAEVRVMLYWTDPPAAVNSSRALVNDLNMVVTNNNQTYLPWVLDPTPNPATLDLPAVRAIDSLNNVEQVTILNPVAGALNISVNGTVQVGGTQKFYVVYYFVADEIKVTFPAGAESLVPGETLQVRWDASPGTSDFNVQWSSNNGQTWTTLGTAGANARYRNWTIPGSVTGQGLVRVTRGNQTAQSPSNFTIMGQPTGISVVVACPDSLVLNWNNVAGANGYVVYVLGNKYMDSIGTTNTNSFTISPYNPTEELWIAVAGRGANNAVGRRSVAIQKLAGLSNCIIGKDVIVTTLLEPKPGKLPSCQPINNFKYQVVNNGFDTLFNIPIGYQINNAAVLWDTVPGPIPANQSVIFTSSHTPTFTIGNQSIIIFSNLIGEQNRYNDTLRISLERYASTTVTIPYTENFSAMALCANNNACGNDVCNLAGGWVNETNGTQDDMDWLVRRGSTPSANTGPPMAFTPATTTGQYLLIESTNCFGKEARVLSPCIDLTSNTLPQMNFRYHMFGATMGELHVDVLADGVLYPDVIQPLIGDKGNNWLLSNVDLSFFAGKTVNVIFRAITGSSWQSDMGIDAIEFSEAANPPTAAFTVSNASPCVNSEIELTDAGNLVQSRVWEITPNTYNLLRGSTLNSRNLFLEFTSFGTYSIKLTVTNPFGQDSVINSQAVIVSGGLPLAIVENFSSGVPPINWSIVNPDNNITWSLSGSVVGPPLGLLYNIATINFFSYQAIGQVDYLVTPTLNMAGVSSPVLTFDVAYARYSASNADGLEIELSTNCGVSFDTIIYSKFSIDLATTTDRTTLFVPNNVNQWRTDTVDLSAFNVADVRLRFKAVNGYGNVLYLMNINILDQNVPAPTASIVLPPAPICSFDTLTFNSASTGSPHTFTWSFGAGANPSTAVGPGPHQVVYLNSGNRRVDLTATNAGGQIATFQNITVAPAPLAAFNAVITGNTVTFNNQSLGNPTSYLWDFGDGNTATVAAPTHTYATGGVYQTKLVISTACGMDSTERQVSFTNISSADYSASLGQLVVSPNPTSGLLSIAMENPLNTLLKLQLTDLAGRLVYVKQINLFQSGGTDRLDLSGLAKGSYLLNISDGDQMRLLKIVLQ